MAEHIVTPCPTCGQLLEIKTNRETGHEFLGCSGWRADGKGCRYTRTLPETILLKRQGIKDMFEESADE